MPETTSDPQDRTSRSTIPSLLLRGDGGSCAIRTPEHDGLTYAGLRELCGQLATFLHERGIGPGDRVAILLPNGPEMASAFLAIASVATAAPLNPAYGSAELQFTLQDLDVRALILKRGEAETARAVAEALGVRIIELDADPATPGRFTLAAEAWPPLSPDEHAPAPRPVGPRDIALVLHTSGTTARPKIVPLSHANLTASAQAIAGSLALTPDDLCLNVMPLFHIHGLVAAVLASLSAGGAVACTGGLNGFRFFGWLEQCRPSWYTAVPTAHQTILEIAPRYRAIIEASRLRLIRSSSASLPAPIMTALEEMFGVPVIEAYGMTEASHQMACNPLPPRLRHPGSVGVAAGPQIAIMDEAGTLLEADQVGEIVIRGPGVMAAYENNPEANARSFTAGWFRTGDQGVLDQAGYLRLTGRLKEIINRGGEKLSPLELESVLLLHPEVREAVAFAMPSRLYGEEPAAAVVLTQGASATAETLRRFVAGHVAAFKVPRAVLVLEALPKGATGKLQRIGMAERLGLAEEAIAS
ncbi:acyl--CoA ligase [Lichenicola sp.]|uniref:acyl--CoA ligase n=1 Tax=Lichenicola sp. TaxID=2804529 RepID=UPI003B00BDC5